MISIIGKAAAARRAGRPDKAEALYRAWMLAEPSNPVPRYGLSTLLLARGEFADGWCFYEARRQIPECGVATPDIPFPEWQGEPIRSLLVVVEQGLGDQIMFARYIPALARLGIDVTWLVAPPLAVLFSGLGARVVPASGTMTLLRCDAWTLVGSLPHRMGPLPPSPYLHGRESGLTRLDAEDLEQEVGAPSGDFSL
jgi:hypothetical protein